MKLFKILPALALILFACTPQSDTNQTTEMPAEDTPTINKAVATIEGLGENEISGTVTFERAEDGVLVNATVNGLNAGQHGFHIHEYGDCTAMDGSSAGGHFNPTNMEHGAPTQDNRHMGDLGNLVAVAGEVATLEYTDTKIDLNQIAGRGIIIHAGEDDLESQPSGAAGDRLACGVVGIALQ